MQKLLEAPLAQDLKPLSIYWTQNGVQHRIVENAGVQVIMLHDSKDAERLKSEYQAFTDGRMEITLRTRQVQQPVTNPFKYLAHFPVTLLLFGLSLAGFFIVYLDQQWAIDLLVIQGVDDSALSRQLDLPKRIATEEYLAHGQYWRLLTPVFLHFGWLHITFNMLWLWELGRRIELQGGSLHLLSVVCFIGIASNMYQAASTPLATFGGMSGVIYGLLGYCAVFTMIAPQRALRLPWEIYVLMLASLVIGYLGVFDFLAQMANTAHLTGLIFGVIIAVPSALLSRWGSQPKENH
ncbi:MAG: rhomboid family intramembrane serine protease [Pseudomonadales bacterium]|nr:rhomboid family intramembrane serine protease [Pseudomonadales bacterium]